MIKVLILGSNSFAGSWFARHCLAQGAEVVGISRSPEPPLHRRPYTWNHSDARFRFRQLDLNTGFPEICELIAHERPSYVADFAAQGMVAPSWKHPEQWYQTNITAKVRLHNFLRDKPYLRRYLRISTPEVYGSTSGAVGPDQPYRPSTPYAVSHAAIDMSLTAFFHQYGFPVVFTRTANFYGPGQQLYRIIPRAMIYARTGRKLTLDGGGTSVRSFIYAEDFVDAMWCAMVHGTPGNCYHIATEEYVTIRSLVEKICTAAEISFEDLVIDGAARPGLDQAYYLDTSMTCEELEWKSRVGVDVGLSRTLAWVDENLDAIMSDELEYVHRP